jgi:hypothetical protein
MSCDEQKVRIAAVNGESVNMGCPRDVADALRLGGEGR